MVYCCQNHSGSPALTAPVPKKALTPCATVYGFDAPGQNVLQAPPSAVLDVAPINASLHALKQAEHVPEEASGMVYDIQSDPGAAHFFLGFALIQLFGKPITYALQALILKKEII